MTLDEFILRWLMEFGETPFRGINNKNRETYRELDKYGTWSELRLPNGKGMVFTIVPGGYKLTKEAIEYVSKVPTN